MMMPNRLHSPVAKGGAERFDQSGKGQCAVDVVGR
jgi:hypothetical protein